MLFKTFKNRYITLRFTWRIGNTSWAAGQRSAGGKGEREERPEALPDLHHKVGQSVTVKEIVKYMAHPNRKM